MTIEDLLGDLRVPYVREGNKHCRPGWLQIDCPYCGPGSQKYHLGYNLAGSYFNCWKCGGLYVPKVLRALGASGNVVADFLRYAESETVVPRERARTSLVVPWGIGPLLRKHREYLRERGFNPKRIQRLWGVQGIGLAPRLSWRLYIPIYEAGRQVSWTTRATGDRVVQRYVSASAEEESKNHKEVVYGADACFHSIVVVEGPTDAWAVGPGAGATFGTAFSPAQVRRISEIPNRFICFDNSPDAQAKARELAEQLSCFPGETQNIQLDAKDPGSADERELKLLRRAAKL